MQQEQRSKIISRLNNLIFILFAGLAFIIPSFFLTITNDYFEFNKKYLFVLTTAVMVLTWCVKMVIEKRFYFVRSPLDVPLLGLLLAFGLSTLTSLDKTSSIFGSYGRWFPGTFAFLTFYIFYYTVTTNLDTMKKVRTVLYALVAGTIIPSAVALANYFELTIPFANLLNQKGVLLTGTSTSLSILALLGVTMSSLLISTVKAIYKKLTFTLVFVVDFAALVVFGGLGYVIAALIIVALGYGKLGLSTVKNSKIFVVPATAVAIAFSVAFFLVPQTKSVLQKDYPKEILPSVNESWIIASTTVRDFPIFGSGVSTFYLNYPRYRTVGQNLTNTWNINFDKPASEIFNILSTMGVFGFAAYALFFTILIKTVLRTTKVNDAYQGLSIVISAGVLGLLASMFLAYTSFQSMFFLFALISLLTVESALNNNKHWAKVSDVSLETKTKHDGVIAEMQLVNKNEVFQYIVALPLTILTAFGLYQAYLQYAPEFLMKRAALAAANQDVNLSYNLQAKVIDINRNRSHYHRMYASTNLILAQSLLNKQDLTDQEKTVLQNLLMQTLRNIKFASENLNPVDPANWLARAQVYKFLMPISKDADQLAIEAYNNTIQLNPTNPALRLELGGIYYSREDYLSAGNLFRQAVNLKPDYANARYNLAHALIKLKAFNEAKTELEIVKNLVEKDSNDYKLVESDLEMVNKEIAKSSSQTSENKISVQELEQKTQAQTEPTSQEPLTKPESKTETDLRKELEQNP